MSLYSALAVYVVLCFLVVARSFLTLRPYHSATLSKYQNVQSVSVSSQQQQQQQTATAAASTASFGRRWMRYSDEEEGDEEDGDEDETDEPTVVPLTGESIGDQTISLIKEGFKTPGFLNGSDVRVGIIMARWNSDVIGGLYQGVNESLTKCGVKPSNVFTTYVPGAFELPVTAKLLAASKRVDVIICLGCLIKGDTMHFEYIADATAQGIMRVSLDTSMPVIFGVLTVMNKEQAVVRSSGAGNEGLSWGTSAVEMGLNRMSALGQLKGQQQQGNRSPGLVQFNTTAGGSGNSTGAEAQNKTKPKFF